MDVRDDLLHKSKQVIITKVQPLLIKFTSFPILIVYYFLKNRKAKLERAIE